MPRWLILITLCVCVQARAELSSSCAIAQKVLIGMNKLDAIKAVGAPYNQSFDIKSGTTTQFIFELDKHAFVELYLTFDKSGLLSHKEVVGSDCSS